MAFIVNKKVFCVLEFAKTESIVTVQRRFRIMYHTEPPTDKTIREWYMNSSRVAACALPNEQAVRDYGPVCVYKYIYIYIYIQGDSEINVSTWEAIVLVFVRRKFTKGPCLHVPNSPLAFRMLLPAYQLRRTTRDLRKRVAKWIEKDGGILEHLLYTIGNCHFCAKKNVSFKH